MMWYDGSDAGSWLWMGGMMVLFWGAIILLAVWAVSAFSGPRHASDGAIDVLRRRLAAGEISPEDFEKTKKLLGA